ncbi:MAG: regulatory protein RecX [Alphaproteobacteria bacterium]
MAKEPKIITKDRLRNIALYYLERYPSSSGNLRIVLHRRIRRSRQFHEFDVDEAHEWVEQHIVRFQEIGYLDDRSYAESKARNLWKKGKSTRFIQGYLRSKMVDKEAVDLALETLQEAVSGGEDEEAVNLDQVAAETYARKRGLGSYRLKPPTPERLQKDMAALMRSGFSYGIAKAVILGE